MWRQCIHILEFAKVRKLLSLFAVTPMGKAEALKLEPFADLFQVDETLALTSEMKAAICAGLRLPLDGVGDVQRHVEIAGAGGGPLMADVLWAIGQTAQAVNAVGRALGHLGAPFPRVRRLGNRIPKLDHLSAEIERSVDPSGIVRDSASPELSDIRGRLAEVRRKVHDRLQGIINSPSLRTHLQYPNYTVVRDRYVLPVIAQFKGDVAGIVHGHSDSGATLYIEPSGIVALGNELVDLQSEAEDEERRIRLKLTRMVGEDADRFTRALELVTAIDLASAKAQLSIDYQMTEPKIVDHTTLNLRGARHPLLLYLHTRRPGETAEEAEQQTPRRPEPGSVTPMDIHLGDQFNVLIITGPNTGGKTVALKTVGLLCLMACAGMHVTAESATIPFYDYVFADIGDEQSLEQSLSTFSSHLSHIVEFLKKASNHSLVLLDELGAGTDPIEGAALARVVVEELAARGTSAIVTTHLGELKQLGFTHKGVENSCMEFDAKTLKPTYTLAIGTPGKSNALEIAQSMGFPERLLAGARERTKELLAESHEKIMEQIQKIREESERRLQRSQQLEADAEGLKKQHEALLQRLQDEELRKNAGWALEIRDKLGQLAQESHQLYDEFRFSHKAAAQRLKDVSTALRELHTKLSDLVAQHSPERTVEPGDEVYLPRLHRWGTVVRLKKRDGTIIISYGQATAELPMTEVMLWQDMGKEGT